MSLDIVKELMDEFEKRNIPEFECEMPGIKVKLSKNNSNQSGEDDKDSIIGTQSNKINKADNNKQNVNQIDNSNNNDNNTYKTIKSPMVGIFYSCPKPNSKSYVKEGDYVKKGDVVCIIEAMKLMNEIESDLDGQIVEVLVKDGEMVEYDQDLFKVI